MKPRSMMGIASPTGSHIPVLEAAVKALPAGAIVVEHGAGLYSTPLLARLGARVLCCEPHDGWREWARWIYQGRAEMIESWKALSLQSAALVFIDGPAAERGPLFAACVAAKVPTIIAHDTDEGDWDAYGWRADHFSMSAYDVSHSSEWRHRTTLWRRHTGVPFAP